jgi:hypothetical protein
MSDRSSKEQLIQYLRVALDLAKQQSDGLAYIASVPLTEILLELLESSVPETACRIDDKDIRMFLGWLSVELPELHAIETSRLGRAWEKWLELMHAQETSEPREWHFDRYRNGKLMAQGVKVTRAKSEAEAWEIAKSLLHLDGNLPTDELRLAQNGRAELE